MTHKIGPKFITVDGKRVGVTYHVGPWVPGVDPTTIKIYPKRYSFPNEIRSVFAIENNSDMMTDYFERDSIRLTASHPLYAEVSKAAALRNA